MPYIAPPGAAGIFIAALEAVSEYNCEDLWHDPMDGKQVKNAFDRLLLTEQPDKALEMLVQSGVMQDVLPEVAAMVDFGRGIDHKNVWEHTLRVVLQIPPRIDVRWAALLHDMGKVQTRKFEPDGQVSFFDHPEKGAQMFDNIACFIPFSEESRKRIRFLIAYHMRTMLYDETWTDSAVRRFAREAGDALEDIIDLSRADNTSKRADNVYRRISKIANLAMRVQEVKAEDAKPAPLPKGLGNAIIERLGIKSGPELGQLMNRLRDEVEAGSLDVQREYEYYIEFIKNNQEFLPK